MSPLRRLGLRLLLALGAALLTALVAEAALRAWFALRPRHVLADTLAEVGAFPQGGDGRWLAALATVDNERIAYRLAPGVDGFIDMGGSRVRVQANSLGFRGPEWTREKPPGTRRIVGLGDSVMMGWGVEAQEAYLARVAAELAARHGERRYEAINLAIGGYNTVQEVETLREVGLAFQPDLVILGVVTNDSNDIIYKAAPPSPATLERSFLYDAATQPNGAGWPPAHRGWESLGGALEQLVAMQREHGFALLVISDESTPNTRRILEMARGLGVRTLDLSEAIGQRVRAERIAVADLTLPKDRHPSALANRLIADELVETVERLLP